MHVGSFYGMTAPFVVLFYEQQGANLLQQAASLINNPVDQTYIKGTYKELSYFKKYLMKIPATYEQNMDTTFLKQHPSAGVADGVLYGDFTESEQEMWRILKRYFLIFTSIHIVSDSNPQFIDCEKFSDVSLEGVKATITQYVTVFLQGATFTFENIEAAVNRCARTMLDRRNKEGLTKKKQMIANMIVEAYSLQQKIRNTFNFMGREITLTDDEVKVALYFKSRLKVIDACMDIFSGDVIMENPSIFSLHFRDYLNRAPERILSEIVHMFKSAGAVIGRETQIPAIHERALADLREFQRLFDSNVLASNTEEISTGENIFQQIEDYYKEPNDALYPIDKSLSYQALLHAKLAMDATTLDTFNTLIQIEEFVNSLNMSDLNAYFGTNMSSEEWKASVTNLRDAGVGGLHFFSKTLFYQILSSYSFELTIKVHKEATEIEKFKHILSEAQAFLDSMMPLGAKI